MMIIEEILKSFEEQRCVYCGSTNTAKNSFQANADDSYTCISCGVIHETKKILDAKEITVTGKCGILILMTKPSHGESQDNKTQ